MASRTQRDVPQMVLLPVLSILLVWQNGENEREAVESFSSRWSKLKVRGERKRKVHIEIERKHHPIYCPVPSSLFRSSTRAELEENWQWEGEKESENENKSVSVRVTEEREKERGRRGRTCYSIFYYCLVIYNLYIIN